tara:strand:- start:311 stop:784 length:474 start_codon:yes stop_codon:yes gene_type:complete
MNIKYLNIYNNLVKLTRNKNFYEKLGKTETFNHRLVLLFFHFSCFFKIYKDTLTKKESQDIFDFFFRQIELSIREIGYGDQSVNKKMKQYVHLFYSILDKIELWDNKNIDDKMGFFSNYLDISINIEYYVKYFDNFLLLLSKNSINDFTKDIIDLPN